MTVLTKELTADSVIDIETVLLSEFTDDLSLVAFTELPLQDSILEIENLD